MSKRTDFTFTSSDGKTQIHAIKWEPTAKIVACMQIAHGVAEYIGRYEAFANYLCDQGILVYGNDHLGHGESLTADKTPVYFGKGNTWMTVVDDLHLLHDIMSKEYPDVPHIFMGHSMGSFLARTFLIRYPGEVKSAIVMGTGWQPGATVAAGKLIAKILGSKSDNITSDFITGLAFGAYNKPFEPKRTEFDWLSADNGNVDRYIADPLCGQPTTVGLFREMLSGIQYNQKASNIANMDKNTPILLISGAMDPVGDCSKGVNKTYDVFTAAGLSVSKILYDGLRHEILNEDAQKQKVYDDIYSFIREKAL